MPPTDPSPAPLPLPEPPFTTLWETDLTGVSARRGPWLWQGYVAPGSVTLLTSQWKSGKTKLMSVLLRRLRAGGTLAGLPVRAGKAVVISEEPSEHWERRSMRLPFGPQVCWLCQPLRGKPTLPEWERLLDHVLTLHREYVLDLVVIDALAGFLPGSENDAGAVLAALLPLRRLTSAGLAVWPLHHPKKGPTLLGQAARGSGALAASVDILLEMSWYGDPDDGDRRRRLRAFSRFEETPRRLVIELSADGGDYLSRGDFEEDAFAQTWQRLESVLAGAGRKLTRGDILRAWPPAEPRPQPHALWRWLERGVAEGKVRRAGSGRKGDPFRYWLAAQEEEWRKDPLYQLEEADEELRRHLAELERQFGR
jgi:hypothetical protein